MEPNQERNKAGSVGAADGKAIAILQARELDSALSRQMPPSEICKKLRALKGPPKKVLGEMINAGRIFAPDFRFQCDEADRRLIYELSDDAPEIICNNYFRQVRGMRMVAARLRAYTMRGRVNICMDEPFSDGARHEVHDIFSRKGNVEEYARALASLPNLGANDIASTIWAGRIYQDDFFRAAPQRLKLKMLEHLHEASPVIAQDFVAQILQDVRLPRRYRVLAWAEGVLRPHREYATQNAAVKHSYAASRESRRRRRAERRAGGYRPDRSGRGAEIFDWLVLYSGGDTPARFDIERNLRGFQLTWHIIDWLASHSAQNILTYYLTECTDELTRVFPLGEFAAYLCENELCHCVIPLLQIIEKLEPGLMSEYMDENGANLLEHLLYRHDEMEPEKGSWLQMCFGRKTETRALEAYLMSVGCEDDVPNGVGITWMDIRDAAQEK